MSLTIKKSTQVCSAAASCTVSAYRVTSLEFPFCRSSCHRINTTSTVAEVHSNTTATRREKHRRRALEAPEDTEPKKSIQPSAQLVNISKQQAVKTKTGVVHSMVAYTTSPGDMEMGLEEKTVVFVEKRSSTSSVWKVMGVLLLVALCLGGILLFAWYWNGRPEIMEKSGHTEALIEKNTAEKTDPHYTLRRISSKAKAAIHLEGSYDERKSAKLEWKNGQGQAFAQGGFQLVENRIIIPKTGLYFVYSQASFRVSCSDADEEEAGKHHKPLSHKILRFSDSIGSDASLMSAVRSACQNTAQEDSYGVGQGWYNTIYLGAVFQLNRGDSLWTETNQPTELETEEGKTFFGVFAL